MTRFEYDNTVRDLLGDDTHPASALPPEEEALGFNNQASALVVSELLAEKYLTVAEDIARRAVEGDKLLALLGCDNGDCIDSFLASFGKRAWRRPLAADELERLAALYQTGHDLDPNAADLERVRDGVRLVLSAFLQSPHFLYRPEFGLPETEREGAYQLGPYEIASRLSYMLWNSMPDAELFAAADEGRLGTKEDVAREARRMLTDARVRSMALNFHEQWLKLSRLKTVTKDPAVYPMFDAALKHQMRSDTLLFMDEVLFFGSGTVDEMLGGLLTQASWLTVNASTNGSNPVTRGKFVREQLLCQILLPPPAEMEIKPPPVDPTKTTRERFAQHRDDPACSVCHQLTDLIGYGFEHYDGIGQWRDTENGLPIDATGEIVDAKGIEGPFDGVTELADKLAQSPQVRDCVVLQWFRFGYGRGEIEEDEANIDDLRAAFSDAGFDVRELLVALTQTDAFLYRKPVEEDSP